MTREETINFLRKKLEKNPKSILFARLADFYLKQKRLKEALDLCVQGIENNPDYITGNYILAKIYLTMGDHEKAEAQFKKVISHDRYFLSAHKHLADMMVKIGWENKAINHYKDILQLDPLEQEAAQMLETFSIEESAGETGIAEEGFPTSEDIPEPEEKSEEKGMESSEIDHELRKVFDEENISEEKSQHNIELEEVTAQDEVKAEADETENSDIEELDFQLPDDESEITPAEKSTEAEEKQETKKPEQPLSEDEVSDNWMLPDGLAEKAGEKEETLPSDQEIKEEQMQEESDILSDDTLSQEMPPESKEGIDQFTEEKETESKTEQTSQESTESISEIPELEPELPNPLLDDEAQESKGPESTDKQTNLSEETEEPSIPSEREEFSPDTSDQQEQEDLEEEIEEVQEIEEEVEQEETVKPEPEETEEIEEEKELEDTEAVEESKEIKQPEQPEPEQPKADTSEKEEKPEQDKPQQEDTLVTPTLGEIYSAQGQYSKALEVYRKLLEKDPDNKEYVKKIQELEKKA